MTKVRLEVSFTPRGARVMSLAQASRSKPLSLLSLLVLVGCGGKISDDASLPIGTGGDSVTDAGGSMTTAGYSALGGSGTHAFGGAGMGGSIDVAPDGGRHLTGGARALGGSRATGGKGSTFVGGAKASGGRAAAGAISSGGVNLAGGGTGTGSSRSTGGTYSNPLPATGGASTVGDVCVMPSSAGDCDGHIQAYYFNPFHGVCEPFIYGGCGGNANRFDSLQACEQRCTQSACPLIIPPSTPNWICPKSAACYYELTTGCRCRAESGECNTDSTCAVDDAGVDASTEPPDAGERMSLPVLFCSCGAAEHWVCREIELVAPFR